VPPYYKRLNYSVRRKAHPQGEGELKVNFLASYVPNWRAQEDIETGAGGPLVRFAASTANASTWRKLIGILPWRPCTQQPRSELTIAGDRHAAPLIASGAAVR
jgi:hypothetical protein